MHCLSHDTDCLAAQLHGRRSRMAAGARLAELGRLGSLAELARELCPQANLRTAADLQRHLFHELAREVPRLCAWLGGAGGRVVSWLLFRWRIENLKVVVRGVFSGTRFEALQRYLAPLPAELDLDWPWLAAAESMEELGRRLPKGMLRASLHRSLSLHRQKPLPFFLEAALDQTCFSELRARADRVRAGERETFEPLVFQEIDTFHLLLATRGRHQQGLAADTLLPLHVEGTRIGRARFADMLDAADANAAVQRALGRALDALPGDGSASVERLAWNRFLRLANRAFRRSHLDLGAVLAYLGLRRVEVANLITLSEGLSRGLAGELIRPRLILCPEPEDAHV